MKQKKLNRKQTIDIALWMEENRDKIVANNWDRRIIAAKMSEHVGGEVSFQMVSSLAKDIGLELPSQKSSKKRPPWRLEQVARALLVLLDVVDTAFSNNVSADKIDNAINKLRSLDRNKLQVIADGNSRRENNANGS